MSSPTFNLNGKKAVFFHQKPSTYFQLVSKRRCFSFKAESPLFLRRACNPEPPSHTVKNGTECKKLEASVARKNASSEKLQHSEPILICDKILGRASELPRSQNWFREKKSDAKLNSLCFLDEERWEWESWRDATRTA